MKDLTEFDHAFDAAFGEQLSDPVQNAWIDDTVYWTAWLGILCDQSFIVMDDYDEFEVDDETARCDYKSPFT